MLAQEDGHIQCVSACPAGFYADAHSGTPACRPCHASCASCSGPLEHECSECAEGHRAARHGERLLCESACPKGSFPSGEACAPCEGASAAPECRCLPGATAEYAADLLTMQIVVSLTQAETANLLRNLPQNDPLELATAKNGVCRALFSAETLRGLDEAPLGSSAAGAHL